MTTTKRIIIIAAILTIAFCILGCLVAYQLFEEGCLWWECAPTRSFDVLDWEIPSDLFPPQATSYNHIYYNDDDNPDTNDSGVQTVYLDGRNGISIYIIDQYDSSNKAKKYFERGKNFFSDRTTKILWSKPEELSYVSSRADDFFVGCGTLSDNDYRCGVIARYQEFVLFFNTSVYETMTYQDFQEIVIYLDEQMSSRLYKE